MANFLEQPRQFNPYIQQIPIDIYSSVGLQKQLDYNSGITKVNSYLQQLSGLGAELVRDVDKEYLNTRITDIRSKVNNAAAADWSSQSLVNQVGSMAGIIENDANIQQAISGSRKYLKDEKDIADAKTGKAGKWAPENEWILRKQMSSWLGSPELGAVYSTSGYKPYQDVTADVIKAWKDAKPNSTLVQRPNGDFYAIEKVDNQVQGKDGKTLIETSVKELRPDEIATEINNLLTPAQREQLAISGLYHFRNEEDTAGISKIIGNHFSDTKKYYQSILAQEQLNLTTTASNPKAIDATRERIKVVEKKLSDLSDSEKQYRSGARENPDAIKSSIYYENWLNSIGSRIGFQETSTKIVDNPAYKVQLEEYKIWASLQKSLNESSKSSKSKKSEKGEDEDEGLFTPLTGTVLAQPEIERQNITLDNFKRQLLDASSATVQQTNDLLYRNFGDRFVSKTIKDLNGDGIQEQVYVLKPGMEKEAALTIGSWWDSFRKGDPNLDITIRQTLADIDEKKLVTNRLAEVISGVEKEADRHISSLPSYQKSQQALKAFNALPSVNVGGIEISPDQVRKYRQLIDEKLVSTPSLGVGSPGGAYMPELSDFELASYGLDRDKYNLLRSGLPGDKIARQHLENLYKANVSITAETNALVKEKQKYINQSVTKYKGIFNEVAITVPTSKPEESRPIINFVQTLAANARETEMGGHTDWPIVRKMIGEENGKNTAYSYVQSRDGKVRIRISNVDVNKGQPEYIDLDSQTAKINKIGMPDYLATTRTLLDLGEGIRTGNSFENSIPTNNGKTGRFSVRHEVENFGGRYKVKLYVTNTSKAEKKPLEVPINTTLFSGWNELSNFLLQDVTEKFLLSLTGVSATPTGIASPNPFPNNPLINSAASGGR